jgi:hypothetical protein
MTNYFLTAITTVGAPVNWEKISVIVAVVVPSLTVLVAAISAYGRLSGVEKSIDKDMKPDIKSLRAKIDRASSDLGGRIDKVHAILLSLKLDQSGAVEGNSPRALTTKGQRILEESGIQAIVPPLSA